VRAAGVVGRPRTLSGNGGFGGADSFAIAQRRCRAAGRTRTSAPPRVNCKAIWPNWDHERLGRAVVRRTSIASGARRR